MKPVRVLCIDDNRLVADALERRLRFEVDMQWAGWIGETSDAMRFVREKHPDVILLDIDMPGRDCFDLVREFVAAMPDVKVVMFSGHVRADYLDRAVDEGAWGYVSKNGTLDDVLTAIQRVAEGEFVLTPDVEAVRDGGSSMHPRAHRPTR